MTQENKDLLLKDLCARLPYRVKARIKYWSNWSNQYSEGVFTVESVNPSMKYLHASSEQCYTEGVVGQDCDFVIEPYLFPLSSMTEDQKKEYNERKHLVSVCHYEYGDVVEEDELWDSPASFQYLIENHFDCNDLIPLGLAIDCTNLNIY